MDFWKYRLLLWVFTARDIKVRYAQTFLGLIWIFLSPLFTVGVFTFVFGVMVKIPSDGLPYLLFYLVAIVPWYAFVAMLNQTMGSVEGNAGLVSKIYFPRLILGCSYALSSGLDYLVGFGMSIMFFPLWKTEHTTIYFIPISLFDSITFCNGDRTLSCSVEFTLQRYQIIHTAGNSAVLFL